MWLPLLFFFSFFVFEYKFLRFPASVSLYLSIICASVYFHFNKRCILCLFFLCTGILSEFLNPGPLLFYALVHDSNGRDMIKTHLLEQRNDIPVLSYSPWEVTKKLCFFNVFQCLSDWTLESKCAGGSPLLHHTVISRHDTVVLAAECWGQYWAHRARAYCITPCGQMTSWCQYR